MTLKHLLALALLAGCAANELDAVEQTSNIGEASCEDAPKDRSAFATYLFHGSCNVGPGSTTDSWVTSYGSNECPNQFLVGYGSQSGYDTSRGWALWRDPLPATQPECQRSHLSVAIYLQNQDTLQWGYHWKVSTGAWSNGACSFEDSGTANVAHTNAPNVLKSRVAASAWTDPPPNCTLCTITWHRVATSMTEEDCP